MIIVFDNYDLEKTVYENLQWYLFYLSSRDIIIILGDIIVF